MNLKKWLVLFFLAGFVGAFAFAQSSDVSMFREDGGVYIKNNSSETVYDVDVRMPSDTITTFREVKPGEYRFVCSTESEFPRNAEITRTRNVGRLKW
jgi:hypothetical protein